MLRFAVVLAGLIVASEAQAACTCRCVNGQMQPLCSSSLDIPPICGPAICPIMSPSIAPIQQPTIPPIGTRDCRQARVCDRDGDCQWRLVCR